MDRRCFVNVNNAVVLVCFWFHCKPIRISSVLIIFFFSNPFQCRGLALHPKLWYGP